MLVIQDKLVSLDLIDQHFVCHLDQCKGACCWEGDFGAPIEEDEIRMVEQILDEILPRLSAESQKKIKKTGIWDEYEDEQERFKGTTLLDNGACVYLVKNDNGFATCAFETAYKEGKTSFYKPISCHLYPVRVTEIPDSNFIALNYDKWDICQSACQWGATLKVPVFEFVKDALIRKFGDDFYMQLEAASLEYFATAGQKK